MHACNTINAGVTHASRTAKSQSNTAVTSSKGLLPIGLCSVSGLIHPRLLAIRTGAAQANEHVLTTGLHPKQASSADGVGIEALPCTIPVVYLLA